ncbi:MAG: MFS transporter [Anaerolineales bacterium]
MGTPTYSTQLPFLFINSFSILFIGMGLMPVLPLYAVDFGASTSVIGLYLSVIYISISTSTMLTGWLATKVGRKRLFVTAGIVSIPALYLMGQATELWQLVVLTAVVWFCGGIGVALINVFTGLYASMENRGKWFSLIALNSPLGALTGGLLVGRLVDWQGYPLMFTVLCFIWASWPVLAYLKLDDRLESETAPAMVKASPPPSLSSKIPLLLLLSAIFLSMMTINVGRLGLPLSMSSLEYTPGEVTTAMAFGGLVTLPFAYFLGVLSDRLGRKNVLTLGYMMAASGVLALIVSSQAWHFALVASMLLIAMTVSGSVASAFATDLLSREVLVRVLPWFSAVGFLAGIVGFAGSGFIIERLGMTGLFVGTAVLSLLAVALIWPLRCERQLAAAFEAAWSCDISFRTPLVPVAVSGDGAALPAEETMELPNTQ